MYGRGELANVLRSGSGLLRRTRDSADALAGGRAGSRIILLLAGTLALDSADKAVIGAIAVTLKKSMGIGNLQLAMLIAAPTLITAVVALPFGALADRINRVGLLSGCILSWAVLMAVCGAANSYLMLLLCRLALGAMIAVVIPVVASLIGDYFQPGERGRIWGYILAGDLVGVAAGYLVAGNIAALFSWRAAFWVLGAFSLLLAPLLWRTLTEPERGEQNWLPADVARKQEGNKCSERPTQAGGGVGRLAEERGIRPHQSLILHDDPATLRFREAARYILSIRTNVVLISASALGYIFFGVLITFGIVFMRNRFELGQASATTLSVGLGAGAIIGVLVSGRLADLLIKRGWINARILMAATAYLCTAAFFLPALLMPSIFVAAPLLFLGAVALGGANPSLDAARLDVMHFQLWGRAESIRATPRYLAQAFAPLVFAGVFVLFSGSGSLFSVATGSVQQGKGGLAYAFAVMLLPTAAAGCLLFLAIRDYQRDVVTARVSERLLRRGHHESRER